MVSPPKSKGHTRYMAERPQYTNDFGWAAALRLPVKEFLVGTGGLERNTAAETYSIANPKRSFFGNQCLDLARSVGCGGSVTGKKGSSFLEVDAVANTCLVGKGTYGTSPLTAKGGSELCDAAKEDCTLGLLNIDADELPRTLDVTRAGATSPTGQADTMQEVFDEEDSKEAALSMTELDQARREMVASAADRKANTRGEHLHFFDRVQIRGVTAEAVGERPSNPESMLLEPGAPNSELDVVLTSHSDNGGECKLGTVKSDIRKRCLYKTMEIPLDSNLLQRHERSVFPENGNVKLSLESPLEASTFVPYTTPIQPSGLLDKLSNNLSIRGFEFGHFSDQENSSAIKSTVLKNLCSKRKASLNVEDAHLQRKYGMNEKNERITPFQDSNESKRNFFHLDVNNAEDGRNWTMALKSSYQDTKVRGLNSAFQYKGKLIKSNYEKKKQVSITGTTKKFGSSNVNGICSEAIVDLGSNRHLQRSFMRWVLSAGKCLGRTQQGFVEDTDSSSGLRKTPRVGELKCMADYLDVAEKHQETTVRISQQGEASTEFFGKDSSIDLAVKSSCPGRHCCNNSGNQSTSQHSGDRKPVDCKQELSITHIKDKNKLAEELVDVSSNVDIPSNRLTTSMEEQRGRSCNLPVLGERLCNAEDNLQPLQDEAKTDEKILERSSNSVARNRLHHHHHLSPAMVHKSSSFLMKNALHNAGALKGWKVGDMWVEGYLVKSKLASPNSHIRTSADSPIRNHFLEAEGIDQNIHLETYSESYHNFHAHDAMKSEITDIRQESAYKIDAELNKRHGEIATLHLDALPGVRFPADGSGDLPSPREIAEFAAAMKTVKTWINQTSSQEKDTSDWHSQILGHVQVCKFCGCQGHTLYKCSETLDPELQELGRRACLWEEKAAEVGKVWCLRCLGSGHWGAQCYQPMNVTAVHDQELNMFKDQNKKNCQSRDKLPSARHFSFLESLTNVQRTLQLPSLLTNASEHHDPAHLSFSGQSETKSQNRKSNVGQNCPAMPGPSKLADYAIPPLMSNQGCANMQRTKEPIIEVKGEKDTSKHMEIMAKKDGESTVLQKSKKRAKVDRQSHKVAQDSKTITKKQFKEEACPEDASKKGANSFPALLQGTKKNWPEEFLRSIPRKILSCIESTRLSRSDIWKYAGCLDFSVRMHGFFLRLRFGHWDEELGGTGYRMGRIKGAATKNLVGKRKIAVSVDLGDIECIVDAKFVSNQAFSQLELFNWWCGMRLKSKSVPKDDELRGLFEQRCQWELE